MDNENVEVITIHRRVTDASREASRENGAKAKSVVQTEEHREKLREAWKSRPRAVCTCGRTDSTHASACPVYPAWKKRESRERLAAEGKTAQ